MTTTQTASASRASYPRYPHRADLRGPSLATRGRTGRVVLGALLAAAAGVVILGAGVLACADLLLTSSPPDTTSTIDPLVRTAGLGEMYRQETDGAPAFGHPSSVSVTAWAPAGTPKPTCVLLYRAVAAGGWTSRGGVTTATCTAPDTRFGEMLSTYRYDTLAAPDGTTVDVAWDTGTDLGRSVTLSREEVLAE